MEPLLGTAGKTPDAAEIADGLSARGEYVVRLDPLPTQQLVDLHWAAHRAGQLLGIKVRVYVQGPIREIDPMVTITISPRRHDRSRLAAG